MSDEAKCAAQRVRYRRWLARHPEERAKINERARLWRQNNPERQRAAQKRWAQAHPDRMCAASSRYRAKYPDKVKAALTAWRKKNRK